MKDANLTRLTAAAARVGRPIETCSDMDLRRQGIGPAGLMLANRMRAAKIRALLEFCASCRATAETEDARFWWPEEVAILDAMG